MRVTLTELLKKAQILEHIEEFRAKSSQTQKFSYEVALGFERKPGNINVESNAPKTMERITRLPVYIQNMLFTGMLDYLPDVGDVLMVTESEEAQDTMVTIVRLKGTGDHFNLLLLR